MRRTRRAGPLSQLVAAVAAALLVFAAASGCGRSSAKTGTDQQAMDTITQQIQATLAKRPDVVDAKVGYQNNLTASERADVTVKVKGGTAFEPVVEEALRLVWQSRLNPLRSINIGVIDADDLQRGESRQIDADDEKTQLEARYGPRPGS